MTITCPRLYPTCNNVRFAFGVPLEDIFPYGDIHPSLKKLLVETFNALCCTTLPIKYTLRYDTPWPDNVLLEKALVGCNQIDYMHPGTLLWMLRHFLGSLPLPLLPKYTDGKTFTWLKISDRCKYALERYIKDRQTNEYLIDILADELLRLPSVNLLLIGYLVNFMRSLVIYPGTEMKFNKNSTVALAKYFTPSIFVRPYVKKHRPKADQLYRPLMLYLLIKWPAIQLKCMEKHPQCFVPLEKRISPIDFKLNLPLPIQRETISTQTHQNLETIEENPLDETASFVDRISYRSDSCSSDSFVTLPEIDFLKDACCQTESSYVQKCNSTQTSLIGLTKRNITRDYPYQFINLDLLEGRYFRYGDYNINYPKLFKTQVSTQTNTINNGDVSSETYISNQEYVYDNYDGIQVISPKSLIDSSLKDLNVIEEQSSSKDSKEKIDDPAIENNDLKVRCSQIGWTYTPTKKQPDNSIGDTAATETDAYKRCHSCLNSPIDDRVKKIEEIPTSININNKEFNKVTNVETPLHASKSKRSLRSLTKLRDKIDFLKIFKDRKVNGSASAEHIRSNIKYQKIETVKSTTF